MIEKILTRVVAPIAIVALGAACAGAMVALSPDAEQQDPAQKVATVEVAEAVPIDQVAILRASGAVQPARQVTLIPEVAGRIVEVHPNLVPGGRVSKGEVLARIDSRDYRIAVSQEQARLRQAEVEYKLEIGRQGIAKREWEILGDGRAASEVPLALRAPQLVAAEHALESAKSGLERAQLNLGRTALRAPFDAAVLAESVDVGQVVSGATQVASLIGTEQVWVKVSVPVEQLAVVDVPGHGAEVGSAARVIQRLPGDATIERPGRVLQMYGELDPQTRTAGLLVVVDDPMRAPGLPLLPGAYVDVEIRGRVLPGTYRVPRVALSDGDRVWVVDDGKLARRTVRIGWREDSDVIVTAGLTAGDQVVTSPLALALEGMAVRIDGDAVGDAHE
ncbi:MAG: RND family efflux transporter MFP subunit [Myxococcota bacterium]|jgi:RND family efflux transporter MFP subunit